MMGACLSGNVGEADTAGRGLPWCDNDDCLAGLSSSGCWPPSETPDAVSLGCNQDDGGRPRFALEVPAACSSAGVVLWACYLHLLARV